MDRTDADDDRLKKEESALSAEDAQQALDHKLDRMAPSRRAGWPKDDQRSSERMSPSAPRSGQGGDVRDDRLPEDGPRQ